MARLDPHSYADLDQGRVRHVDLRLTVDFKARCLVGQVELCLDEAASGPLDLDARGLQIEAVEGVGGALAFDLGPTDPVLGERLRIHRDRPVDRIVVRYRTASDASGLVWLEPEQTASGRHPFLLSQCQAIHARSLVPLQDSPRVRLSYSARITTPDELVAVMSAAPGERVDGAQCFEMPQPIPSYLLALAVGELESRELGPRCRVWAEPDVVESAAWEFEDVERMLEAAEGLFGPYQWERYDFVVLPSAFPLGGMENPRMTFLTPTLLAGDRSLVSVLAHELAHSWTGNLVTNATNEDFWLNEGWTVWAERRILEVLYGRQVAVADAVLGRVELDECIAERQAAGESTALRYPQEGLDPDDDFSKLPYEKGFLLIAALEAAVGRERFDPFVRAYIDRFAFTSITTADFVGFVAEQLGETGVPIEVFLSEEGVPEQAPSFESPALRSLAERAAGWHDGLRPEAGGTVTEQLFYLSCLPADLSGEDCLELEQALGLRGTHNAELLSAWLARAGRAGMTEIEPRLREFLGTIGRTKLVRPVVQGMAAGGMRGLAEELVEENAARWHGSTRRALRKVLAG